jgi:hypothetical protein
MLKCMTEPARTRGEGPSYWRADLRWLTKLPDKAEPMSDVFRRLAHNQIGGGATSLAAFGS